ncbi:unnamed protein product [Phytophthora fragariaefolia]|uniref:Unnamed protein product n=1 Tax=Phytophthora fragariaefolia TaxID=1490495 RepID=A0A9W6TQ01_9STRA|nr:unnamed protein product [Phytophthora fragariaefolia]
MMTSWFRIIHGYRAGGSSSAVSNGSSKAGNNRSSSDSNSGSDSSTNEGGGCRNSSAPESESWPDADSYDSQGDQNGHPAKNITFAEHHGFGTQQYAQYHRCDDHLKKRGSYSSPGSSSYGDSIQQTDSDHIMTAISSTVSNNGNENTGSVTTATQAYAENNSGNNETAEDYYPTTSAGHTYKHADSEVKDTATPKINAKTDSANINIGASQSYAEANTRDQGYRSSKTFTTSFISSSNASDTTGIYGESKAESDAGLSYTTNTADNNSNDVNSVKGENAGYSDADAHQTAAKSVATGSSTNTGSTPSHIRIHTLWIVIDHRRTCLAKTTRFRISPPSLRSKCFRHCLLTSEVHSFKPAFVIVHRLDLTASEKTPIQTCKGCPVQQNKNKYSR